MEMSFYYTSSLYGKWQQGLGKGAVTLQDGRGQGRGKWPVLHDRDPQAGQPPQGLHAVQR